jgi:hypothetical protein
MTTELAKLADAQVKAFERELSRAVTNLNKRLTSLLTKLEIVNGQIVKTPFNLQYLARLQPQMEQALIQSGYLDAVQYLQAGDAELLRAVRESSPLKLIYTKTDATTLNALAQMQNSEFYGIGINAMEAIRQTVMNSVMAGARLEDGLGIIRSQLETRLQPYAWTYANTARKQVMQMAEDLAAQHIPAEERFWAYNGPLDDVTRPCCIELLEIGYFTDAEREEYEALYADERAYNCRHSFDLVSESTYKENRG